MRNSVGMPTHRMSVAYLSLLSSFRAALRSRTVLPCSPEFQIEIVHFVQGDFTLTLAALLGASICISCFVNRPHKPNNTHITFAFCCMQPGAWRGRVHRPSSQSRRGRPNSPVTGDRDGVGARQPRPQLQTRSQSHPTLPPA